MDASQEEILELQIEIDVLEAKLNKKHEINLTEVTHDNEVLYAKRLALAAILEVRA